MAAQTDNGNGLATLSRLDAQMTALREQVAGLREDIHRLDSRIGGRCENHETRIRDGEIKIVGHGQQLSMWAFGQATLTVIASVVAGWFGSRP